MKKYPGPQPTSDSKLKETSDIDDLEFPVAPGFLSLPPRLDPQVMLRRIEENMPWRSTRPGETERRWAVKINVEFVL